MKHVKRFLALSLAAALLAGCVSCGNSDEKTSPTGGGSGVDSTGDGGTLRIARPCLIPIPSPRRGRRVTASSASSSMTPW